MIRDIINQIVPLFVLMIIGVALGRSNAVSKNFRKDLIEFSFQILFPASVICAFKNMPDTQAWTNGIKLILTGLIWIFVPCAVAIFIVRLLKIECKTANVITFAATFGNLGFAGMGIVSNVFGAEGLFYANMLAITYRLTLIPLGITIMQSGTKKANASTENKFIAFLKTPTVAPLLVMILISIIGIRLPDVVFNTVELFNDCLAPIGMLITGMSLSDFKFKELFRGKVCYLLSVIRLVLLPVLTGILMKTLGIAGVAFDSSYLVVGMPVAANCSLLAQKYEADTKLAAQCVLISSLLSVATIPLLMVIGKLIF